VGGTIGSDLESVVLHCLVQAPSARPESARKFAGALRDATRMDRV
jgi:hypothetical protein